MLEKIRTVFERYGFEAVETPAIEYTDALGKFLPDQDRPNEGVFSFQDDDEQWLSLRYDLTAPLARYVAENFDRLPKPYRSYRVGYVFRNEKPGPGRYRQFLQFDADTVGASSVAADAEMCMLAADTLEELGIPRGSYLVNVSNRKVLDGILESIGLLGDANAVRRLRVMRALDKYGRLGRAGIRDLLGIGRKDESGDFTKGAELNDTQIAQLLRLVEFGIIYDMIQRGEFAEAGRFPNPFFHPPATWDAQSYVGREEFLAGKAASLQKVNPKNKKYDYSFNLDVLGEVAFIFEMNDTLAQGLHELAEMEAVFQSSGYVDVVKSESALDDGNVKEDRIRIDPSIVRGLEYYTGPIYEAELAFEVKGDDGKPVRFGSVAGGGRYDGLVARFRGEAVPATGFSIGVSRLMAALQHLGKLDAKTAAGPVVVTVFDQERIADYQRMVKALRDAGINSELYLGSGKMGPQLKYADKRGAPCVVIQGGDEKAKGEVQIKDLVEGARKSEAIASNKEWRETRPAQFSVPETKLVEAVREVLARHGIKS